MKYITPKTINTTTTTEIIIIVLRVFAFAFAASSAAFCCAAISSGVGSFEQPIGIPKRVETVGGQSFDVAGSATPANLSNWLFTGWFYVSAFSLQSSVPATLQNSLVLVTSQMDGSNLPQTISSSANVSNQQFNPNLLNVCCGFILTNTTALRLPITTSPGEVVTLTLTIGACGAYGQLPDFLATNPMLSCGVPANCGIR